MAKMVLWNKKTGEAMECEGVDAREILASAPEVYSTEPPKAKKDDPDGDGFEGAPQNVANVENEFRREPVGANPPAAPREEVIIRNPVTDTPRMAEEPKADEAKAKVEEPKVDDKAKTRK